MGHPFARLAVSILSVSLLACGGATTGVDHESKEAGPDGSKHGKEGGVADAGTCKASPAPDGSPECTGLNPGDCAGGTPCSQEDLQCSVSVSGAEFVFTCCGGQWTCVGP